MNSHRCDSIAFAPYPFFQLEVLLVPDVFFQCSVSVNLRGIKALWELIPLLICFEIYWYLLNIYWNLAYMEIYWAFCTSGTVTCTSHFKKVSSKGFGKKLKNCQWEIKIDGESLWCIWVGKWSICLQKRLIWGGAAFLIFSWSLNSLAWLVLKIMWSSFFAILLAEEIL